MDEGRILIVSLQKGMIGELPARFWGSLLVGHIASTAFSRADLLERGEQPRPFYLFADEFTNFVSRDFDTILSETRKYGVFFRLACQYLEQIDRGLQQGILTNCDTRLCGRNP
jgi:type IV secretory pathway TraG/TraD family ATPase VirD4